MATDEQTQRHHSELRGQFLEDNADNVRAAITTAIGNAAPLEEIVAILVHVDDPFGAPFARALGCKVEELIAKTPPDRLPTYLAIVSRVATSANLGQYFPGLARKLAESHPDRIWVLVGDCGNPELFSLDVSKLNPAGGGDA